MEDERTPSTVPGLPVTGADTSWAWWGGALVDLGALLIAAARMRRRSA